MPLYEHHDGKRVTERVQARPGGPEDRRLAAAVALKGSGWRAVSSGDAEPASADTRG